MTTPTTPAATKGFQSPPQTQQQNGTMPPPPTTQSGQRYLPHQTSSAHAMSGYGMAVTPRHDRVDYSVGKGGFRLWVVLFVFFMLIGGMITIFSNKKEFIEVDLDVDGDGELDDIEHDDDLDDAVHSETKYEQEKHDRSSPTRTTDGIPSPPELGRRRGKTEKKKVDDDDHDHEHDEHDEEHGDHDDHDHEEDHELEHKQDEKDAKESADPRHTVGPNPPLVILKEPLKNVLKKAIGKRQPVSPEDEEEEDDTPIYKEETLLQRLWEKMKETASDKHKKHKRVDEDETEQPRKRAKHGKHVEESEQEEEAEDAKPAEKPRKKSKSKPTVEDVKEHEDEQAEPEEDKAKETEKPAKKRRGELHVVDETPEPEPEQAKHTQEAQEPQIAKSGRRKKTKVEADLPEQESEPEPEPELESERLARIRKTKQPEEPEEEQKEESVAAKPKVRVIRVKGKPKDEPRSAPAPASEPEPEPESESEQEQPSEQPPKPKIPVRVIRTKGKTLEELRHLKHEERHEVDPEPEPEQPAEEPSKPKIPVRVIRTKGKSKEELQHLKHEDHSAADSEPEPELPSESSPGPEVTKQQIKVRYFRVKGKKPDETLQSFAEPKIVKDQEKEVEEDKKKVPVRVFRTKGKKEEEADQETSGGASGEAKGKTTALRVPEYRKHLITNRDDNKIRDILDNADRLVDERRLDEALLAFDKLLKSYPRSPRVHYGKARALEQLAAERQSNTFLDACIREYENTLRLPTLTDGMQRLVTERLVDRARFRGWLDKAAAAQSRLVDKHPNDLTLLNDFGVTYLMMGRHDDAKKIFDNVLTKDPGNGFALVHYGFILKTVDENFTFAVDFMRRGIESEDEGTQDGRFFFHLGDALQKLNRTKEAYEVYEQAAELGIFLSKYQRSLYNVAGLSARPFWTPEQTPFAKQLRVIESEWKIIRDEGLALLNQRTKLFKDDDEEVALYGNLQEFILYSKSRRLDANCAKTPKTCEIVARFPESVTCTRGEVKFSLMEGGTRVWPHCGPTNCRLRGHLGLVVPPDARLRVGDEIKSWKQGKFLILDDSFENEVWHDGSGFRLILVVDFWHPELTPQQRASLTPI